MKVNIITKLMSLLVLFICIPLFVSAHTKKKINHQLIGIATHYGTGLHLKKWGGSGLLVDKNAPIVAHKTLAYGTIIRVINIKTNQNVIVMVFDNGPQAPSRCVDMQPKQFYKLAPPRSGGFKAKIEIINVEYACRGQNYDCLKKRFGHRRLTKEDVPELSW